MPHQTCENKQHSWIPEAEPRDAHERSIQNWENEGGVFHGLTQKLLAIPSPTLAVH